MSQLKRDSSSFRFGQAEKSSATQAIDESQPHQTLELQRAAEFWQRSDSRGGDPYNAVGAALLKRTSAA